MWCVAPESNTHFADAIFADFSSIAVHALGKVELLTVALLSVLWF